MSQNFIGGLISLYIAVIILSPPSEPLIYKTCRRCHSPAYQSRNYWDAGQWVCTGPCHDYTQVKISSNRRDRREGE